MREIEEAVGGGDREAIEAEIGDLFFALANLSRPVNVDPEQATRGANAKFVRRFASIERGLKARGSNLEGATIDEMDALWNEAKRDERGTN